MFGNQREVKESEVRSRENSTETRNVFQKSEKLENSVTINLTKFANVSYAVLCIWLLNIFFKYFDFLALTLSLKHLSIPHYRVMSRCTPQADPTRPRVAQGDPRRPGDFSVG